jgi:hypothetical protein
MQIDKQAFAVNNLMKICGVISKRYTKDFKLRKAQEYLELEYRYLRQANKTNTLKPEALYYFHRNYGNNLVWLSKGNKTSEKYVKGRSHLSLSSFMQNNTKSKLDQEVFDKSTYTDKSKHYFDCAEFSKVIGIFKSKDVADLSNRSFTIYLKSLAIEKEYGTLFEKLIERKEGKGNKFTSTILGPLLLILLELIVIEDELKAHVNGDHFAEVKKRNVYYIKC